MSKRIPCYTSYYVETVEFRNRIRIFFYVGKLNSATERDFEIFLLLMSWLDRVH